jgi:hypothetical protein
MRTLIRKALDPAATKPRPTTKPTTTHRPTTKPSTTTTPAPDLAEACAYNPTSPG